MWVLTENGRLINLDHFYVLEVAGPQNEPVVVAHGEPDISAVLCSCDNEEHGTEIVQHIADALESGVKLYDIRSPWRSARW